MRSPGVIYRKYRQIRRKILHEKIQDARRRVHRNCHYGKIVTYTEHGVTRQVPMCMFPVKHGEGGPDVCTCPGECNAFAGKWTPKLVAEQFERELQDIRVMRRLYPELATLGWVLDKSLTDAMERPSWFGKILVSMINCLEELLKRISGPKKRLMEKP